MIVNLWKQIEVYCGNHGDDHTVKMGLKEGHRSMFYSCPKYYPENRDGHERACKNNVDTVIFEKILDRLSDEMEKRSSFGQEPDLTNFTFKVRSIDVTVIEHDRDSIKILVLNHAALA